MKKWCFIIGIFAMLVLTGCASKEDKALAQAVITQINNIESVTIANADEMYNVYKAYSALTEKQQKLVKNRDDFFEKVSILKKLIIDTEMAKDPTSAIKESDLVGIWCQEQKDSHRGYFYFTLDGSVYYLASKSEAISEYSFTKDYRVSNSYSLDIYNRTTGTKNGSFKNLTNGSKATFSVTEDFTGSLTMEMSCGAASGTYIKTGVDVDTSPKRCMHSECTEMAVLSGITSYCEEHSNNCLHCGKYIDEDAMICIRCVDEAFSH